jgi:hypothetical protein
MNGAHARDSDPDTSHAAAASVSVTKLEQLCIDMLRAHGNLTTFEATEHAIAAGWSELTRDSLSPRFTTLRRKGLVYDTGQKRRREGGKASIVWALSGTGVEMPLLIYVIGLTIL